MSVILHGGEPLLAGAARLAEIARQLRRAVTPVCALDLRVHTNGVRLDEEFCEVFLAAGVKVGVSLDGDRAGNDLHRRYRDGRSSYDQVIRAVGLLRSDRYRELYAGLLCTIDVRNDPVATYDALAALEPPAVDFLLPHATHDTPPPGGGARPGDAARRLARGGVRPVAGRCLPGPGADVRVGHPHLARSRLADRVARAGAE